MLWFGRIAVEIRWPRAASLLVKEALEELLSHARRCASDGGGGTLYLDPALSRRWIGTLEGRLARLTFSVILPTQLERQPTWASEPPPAAVFDYIHCSVSRHSDGCTLAQAYFASGGCYLEAELARALEISLEDASPRPGKASVLRSARLPPPLLRSLRASDLTKPLAVFRCKNPCCLSRGAEVLVRLSNEADALNQAIRQTGVVAYPCPSCIGSCSTRWALTWVRSQPAGAPTGSHSVVEFPIEPTQPRLIARADTLQNVTAAPGEVNWGSVWDRTKVSRIPSPVMRFTRYPRPQALLRAFATDPLAAGALSAYLLTPDNLRAFVDFCRTLPAGRKGGRIPAALALAFNPRRPNCYHTERDDCQTLDGHYPYIAFHPESFFAQLRFYRVLNHPGRFLDVGSGLGEKVFLAYALGRFSECHGLEYDPRTVAVAEFLLASIAPRDPYPIQMLHGDALSFDRYADYDVIYTYRPFHDPNRMESLVRRIALQMKVGAVLFDVIQPCLALRKMAPDKFATAIQGPGGFANWAEMVELDEFLVRHGLSASGVHRSAIMIR